MSNSDGDSNYLKMWIVSGGLVVVLALVLLFLQLGVHGKIVYGASDLALRCVHEDQCERPGSDKLLAEFQNTVSNLAYLLFGVCVLVRAGRDGLSVSERPGMVFFGLSMCFLAVCSGYYHATLNFAGTFTQDAGGGAQRASVIAGHPPYLQCLPPQHEHTAPQVLDLVGVYAALISLFLYATESAFRQWTAAAGAKRAWAAGLGIGLPLVGVVLLAVMNGKNAFGGPGAGLVLLFLLMFLSLFVFGAYRAATDKEPHTWAMWLVWLMVAAVTGVVSYFFKAELDWDSTAVFVAMMFFLLAAIAASWILTTVPSPQPEFIVLGIVFLLGIAPRLLDGYETDTSVAQLIVRKALCKPDSLVQGHALWHVMSAIALVLTFDIVQKSRPQGDSSGGTVLLPRSGVFSDDMRASLGQQSFQAIFLKAGLSAASLLLLAWCIRGGAAGIFMGVLACVLVALLWLCPVLWKR